MFTFPSGGSGGILVARPSASTGTITNAGNAYDLPGGLSDDPPYTTSADRATVTGSATAGTVDYDVVEFNTFPSRSKANFSVCNLKVGVSTSLSATCLSLVSGGGNSTNVFVCSDLTIDYQINGSTWVNLKNFQCDYGFDSGGSMGVAANNSANISDLFIPVGEIVTFATAKATYSVNIPSASFPSNLNSLKVRFRLGTCKNSVVTTYQSSGSYQIWDIRANIS